MTFLWMTQSGGEMKHVDLAKQELRFTLSCSDSEIDVMTKGLLQTHTRTHAQTQRLALH